MRSLLLATLGSLTISGTRLRRVDCSIEATCCRAFLAAAVLLSGIGMATSAQAATYYVATNGNDANPGTLALPWTLRKAAASVVAGDVVLIKAGTYGTKGFQFNRAGTAAQPITYKAYGDGEVLITNSWVLPSASWTLHQGSIYKAQITTTPTYIFQDSLPLSKGAGSYSIDSVSKMVPNTYFVSGSTLYVWLLDGSDPKNSVLRAADFHALELKNSHYSIFEGLTVAYGYNGFKDQGTPTHHVTFRNCIVRSIGSQGIQPVPADAVIEGNIFQWIGSNKFQHAIYTSTPGVIIRNNVFEQIAGAAIHLYSENYLGAGGYEIYGNVFRKPLKLTLNNNNSGSWYYGDMIIWESGGNKIYNNVLYGEGKRWGISLNSPNNLVYNNTLIGSTNDVMFSSSSGKTGNKIFNNIFVKSGSASFFSWYSASGSQTLNTNLYFNTSGTPKWQKDGVSYTSFSTWQSAAGETNSLYANPALVNPSGSAAADAMLKASSPAIDKGANLSPTVAKDFNGVARPQGPAYDIGAFELGTTGIQSGPPTDLEVK